MSKDAKTQNKVYLVIGFVLLVAIAIVAVRLIIAFGEVIIYCFENYRELSVAVVTGLLAFASMMIGKIIENSQRIKNECRKERQEIYAELADWLLDICFFGNNPSSPEDLGKIMSKYQKQITTYASDKVFKAWGALRESLMHFSKLSDETNERKAQLVVVVNAAEKLLLALRKDLGYKNRQIKQYDIARLYIKDFGDIVPNKK